MNFVSASLWGAFLSQTSWPLAYQAYCKDQFESYSVQLCRQRPAFMAQSRKSTLSRLIKYAGNAARCFLYHCGKCSGKLVDLSEFLWRRLAGVGGSVIAVSIKTNGFA